jgi:hypothetical protein
MNEHKLTAALEIRARIEDLNRSLKFWEGETKVAPHTSSFHDRYARGPMPAADRAWREYVSRVIEEVTTQRDQLKREFEVL